MSEPTGKDLAKELASNIHFLEDALADEARRGRQQDTNVRWLIDQFDRAHGFLCPDGVGAWQERVRQVVVAVENAAAVLACIQTCPQGHKYYARSHEYPCPLCRLAALERMPLEPCLPLGGGEDYTDPRR